MVSERAGCGANVGGQTCQCPCSAPTGGCPVLRGRHRHALESFLGPARRLAGDCRIWPHAWQHARRTHLPSHPLTTCRHTTHPTTDWDAKAEEPANQQLWEADWDDDDVGDDFSARLKAELARQQQQQQQQGTK